MTPRQIDKFCASLPAATRIVQWEGVAVFKVGGKMSRIRCQWHKAFSRARYPFLAVDYQIGLEDLNGLCNALASAIGVYAARSLSPPRFGTGLPPPPGPPE